MGIRVWWRKIKRKKKEKEKEKKRNLWMIERKKGKIIYKKKKGQFRNSTIIFSQ